MTQSSPQLPAPHPTLAPIVACLAGFLAFVGALLLAGSAFNAARFDAFVPAHWRIVVVACAFMPLIGLAGIAGDALGARRRLRTALVLVGGLGTCALAASETLRGVPHVGYVSLLKGGPLAAVALSATGVALAAVVMVVAGLGTVRGTTRGRDEA